MSNLKDPKAESREQELEKLFSNIPYQNEMFIDLPSKGKFYKNFKTVKVIPLLFEDEQRILMSKNKNINPVNEILAKCVDGVGINELLAMDKLYLLMKIKEISYGPDYKFTIICPNCNENVESALAINDIPVNSVPDDLEDPREVMLPMLRVPAKIRFPRSVDEHYFNDSESTTTNLYRLIVSLNGNEDSIFISKAIKKMHIRDIKTIEKEINRKEFGINTSFQFECPHCKHNAILGIPFDANFFSVN
jgi:hypothetical protein